MEVVGEIEMATDLGKEEEMKIHMFLYFGNMSRQLSWKLHFEK